MAVGWMAAAIMYYVGSIAAPLVWLATGGALLYLVLAPAVHQL
jgi:hypothetical protein